jgi:hypothetical protein
MEYTKTPETPEESEISPESSTVAREKPVQPEKTDLASHSPEQEGLPNLDEITVLDYVKSFFQRGNPLSRIVKLGIVLEPQDEVDTQQISEDIAVSPPMVIITKPLEEVGEREKVEAPQSSDIEPVEEQAMPMTYKATWPWRSVLAVIFCIFGQRFFEPPESQVPTGLFLYAVGVLAMIWAYLAQEWELPVLREVEKGVFSSKVRGVFLALALPVLTLAFLMFNDNRFTSMNLFLWVAGLALVVLSLTDKGSVISFIMAAIKNVRKWLAPSGMKIYIKPFTILVILVVLLVIAFRFGDLKGIPGEMFSDHAEKLLDVNDVLAGQYSIFFPRNTGREAFQMYLTALVAIVFGTGLSFMSLKIGTVLAGLFALPFIYLLGKEIGNRWVGLAAFFLAGIAYWPNVISRVGLRFPLYALFAAPTLFYLIRGLRRQHRNDFIWAGIFLGLGMHGYSPFRLVPVVVVMGVLLYIAHHQPKNMRVQAIVGLAIITFVSFMVFLPLFRYMLGDPDMFGYRAFTRLGTTEREFPAPVWQIFFSNFWKASIMPFWRNGSIWVHSVPDRPALDVVSAVFYLIGVVLVMIRYIRQRHWEDLLILVSVPLLLMPSILSLAFPDENPSLNRTSGAIVPVFILAGIGLESFIRNLVTGSRTRWLKFLSAALVTFLLMWTINQNYDLVFKTFKTQFLAGAWNTSQIGAVIRGFADSVGTQDTAYVVPFPYWVDTRLVGINAGFPLKDYALWPENFQTTLEVTGPKMYIIKGEDLADLDLLKQMYPLGSVRYYSNTREGKTFFVFLVP